MNTNQSPDACRQLRRVLASIGSGELSPEIGYERLAAEVQRFARKCGCDKSPAEYVRVGEHLRDEAYPEWPLRGMPCDPRDLPASEEKVSIARAIGLYLSVAIEESEGDEKIGSEMVDKYLDTSGLLPLDVRE